MNREWYNNSLRPLSEAATRKVAMPSVARAYRGVLTGGLSNQLMHLAEALERACSADAYLVLRPAASTSAGLTTSTRRPATRSPTSSIYLARPACCGRADS